MLEASGTPESSALLHFFRPRVARDMGINEASLSMNEVLDKMRQARFLQARGPFNLSQWDTFHQGWAERKPEISLLCLLLVSFGVKMGFFGQGESYFGRSLFIRGSGGGRTCDNVRRVPRKAVGPLQKQAALCHHGPSQYGSPLRLRRMVLSVESTVRSTSRSAHPCSERPS